RHPRLGSRGGRPGTIRQPGRDRAMVTSAGSEGNVVVLRHRRGGHVLAAAVLAGAARRVAATAPEELDALGDDLGGGALVPVLVVVLSCADRALDVHLPALLQVLAARLALLSPHHHVVPLGALLALPLAVVPDLAGGDWKPRHRLSSSRETHLRILPEVP